MPVRVRLYPWLHRAAEGLEAAEVPGHTLGECLQNIASSYPKTRRILFDEKGALKSYIVILRNGETTDPDGSTHVEDGDELAFLFLIDGG